MLMMDVDVTSAADAVSWMSSSVKGSNFAVQTWLGQRSLRVRVLDCMLLLPDDFMMQ